MKINQPFNWLTAVAVCSFTFFPGCTDLDEEPFGAYAAGEFGETPEEFSAILVGGYTTLYETLGNHNSYYSLQEISSDEAVIPTRGADWGDGGQWTRVHTHEYNRDEQSINNAWVKLYSSIATINQLILQLPLIDADRAEPFVLELRGLRALNYFYLLDLYGNVPIIRDFTSLEPPATSPRVEVYNFVVGELEEIIPALPNEALYARFTRPVAQSLLAKVYLNADVYGGGEQYDRVLTLTDSIINTGLYSLEAEYFINFNADNAGSRENIFAIPYDELDGPGFVLGQMTLHYVSQETFNSQQTPWNGYASLQEFYDSYEDEDLRKGVPGDQQIRGNFLAGPQFKADGRTPILDPSADDPGGDQVVFTPEINELAPGAFRQAGVRFAKFEFEQGFLPNLNNDFPIFRYADILLMKAEALIRMNGDDDSDAMDLVNLVRGRAYGEDDDGNMLGQITDLDLDDLLAERGREMFAEAYRRQDLIRFGEYNDAWFAKPASDPSKNIMPIPAAQLQANPNLVQNPGY